MRALLPKLTTLGFVAGIFTLSGGETFAFDPFPCSNVRHGDFFTATVQNNTGANLPVNTDLFIKYTAAAAFGTIVKHRLQKAVLKGGSVSFQGGELAGACTAKRDKP